jgi:hypothetical protein
MSGQIDVQLKSCLYSDQSICAYSKFSVFIFDIYYVSPFDGTTGNSSSLTNHILKGDEDNIYYFKEAA